MENENSKNQNLGEESTPIEVKLPDAKIERQVNPKIIESVDESKTPIAEVKTVTTRTDYYKLEQLKIMKEQAETELQATIEAKQRQNDQNDEFIANIQKRLDNLNVQIELFSDKQDAPTAEE